jgi:hypothetical protein
MQRLQAAGVAPVALVAMVGLALPVPRADSNSSSEEAQFVARINAFREDHGLQPLAVDAQLTMVARNWSAQMAQAQHSSHNPELEAEDGPAAKLGENAGNGESVDWLERSFEQSPEHEKNLLDPDFRLLGVGVVDTPGEVWVTQDFKQPQGDAGSATAPSDPAPAPTPPDGPAGRVHVLAPAPTYDSATAGVVGSATASSARAAGPAPTNDDNDAVAAANLRHALATWTSFTG